MVKQIKRRDNTYFICESCNMCYKDEIIAKKCEKHCEEKHACDINLIKHAIKI